ncbi:MAG: hypothetical protein A3H91_16815 [Gammaproteobacteria bacterium RIFCSPLOWO2_02_FULL_61_13]|nr:MAG: hypothetical protein A3H91_16815 [Gammaproteobacteria bacterium RIFCSPLOWO2_02_FULL_61_13]
MGKIELPVLCHVVGFDTVDEYQGLVCFATSDPDLGKCSNRPQPADIHTGHRIQQIGHERVLALFYFFPGDYCHGTADSIGGYRRSARRDHDLVHEAKARGVNC